MSAQTKHNQHCPRCGRYVPKDADGFYSRIDPYLVEDSETGLKVWPDESSYSAAFCNERCADKYDAGYRARLTAGIHNKGE